jgi:PKD repeat protein
MNICYDVPGVYDVTLITTNANGNDTTTLNDYISVYDTPAFPTIAQVGYTLIASAAATYQWQLNATDIPGATDQTYDVLQTGYYTVIVTDGHGCKNSSTLYVQITGLAGIFGDAICSIYPNPSKANFIVELQNAEGTGAITLDIVNTLGQLVYSSSEMISVNDWKKEIDLNEITQGVYFLEIKKTDLLLRKKIIITK